MRRKGKGIAENLFEGAKGRPFDKLRAGGTTWRKINFSLNILEAFA
jgi:hypothetical protein